MLFTFSDIATRAASVFEAWFTKRDRLQDARTLYLVGLYGKGYIEHRLLALTQGAEAYHHQFFPGWYMDHAPFKADVLAPLTAAVPSNIDSSHRTAILARLKFANEYSLRRRLRDLFDAHGDALSALVQDPGKCISPIVDMRNEFTHFAAPALGADARRPGSEHAFRYNWILRLLLESCFLTEIGFTHEEVVELVRRSEMYRQMSRRFQE